MFSSSPNQNEEVYDELNFHTYPEMKDLLDHGEHVFFSGDLSKINKYHTHQDRILVITNKHIYNIQPHENLLSKLTFLIAPHSTVKRKIPVSQLWGMTISSREFCDQFVIHVENDYDYRYEGETRPEIILRSLCNAFFNHENKPFPLYIMDDEDLEKYQTTDDDYKVGINKKPNGGQIYITREILNRGLAWIIANRRELVKESTGIDRYSEHIPHVGCIEHVVVDYREQTQPFDQTNNNSLGDQEPLLNQNNNLGDFGTAPSYQEQQNEIYNPQAYNPELRNQGNTGGFGVQAPNYQGQQNELYNPQAYNPDLSNQANTGKPGIEQSLQAGTGLNDFLRAELDPNNSNVNFNVAINFDDVPNTNFNNTY
jgi:hypothetical protein